MKRNAPLHYKVSRKWKEVCRIMASGESIRKVFVLFQKANCIIKATVEENLKGGNTEMEKLKKVLPPTKVTEPQRTLTLFSILTENYEDFKH